MKDYIVRNWQTLAIGVGIILFGAYWCIAGMSGPPAKADLVHVVGNVEKIVMHIDENAVGVETKSHAMIHLEDGQGSYRYDADQRGGRGMKTFVPGEPVELWVDDRITVSEGVIEIWAFKRNGEFVCTYEQNLAKVSEASGSVRMVMGIIAMLIGAAVIKQNTK